MPDRERVRRPMIARQFLKSTFSEEFSDSIMDCKWNRWINAIHDFKTREEEKLDAHFSPRIDAAGSEEEKDWLCDFAADERYTIEEIHNSMCGSLVVGLWSRVEYYLKHTLSIMTGERVLHTVNIGEIKGKYDLHGKDIRLLNSFNIANGIRLSCNAFKHNAGCYYSKAEKSFEKFDPEVFPLFSIDEEDINSEKKMMELRYDNFDYPGLFAGTKAFVADLLRYLD